jgi:putative DNA primase/helicase
MSAANVTPLITDPVAAPIDRPQYRVYDHPLTLDGVKLRAGVWHHGNKQDSDTGDAVPFDEWLCGPLHVEAITRNEGQDGDYGKLLRFHRQPTPQAPGDRGHVYRLAHARAIHHAA